MEKWFSKSLIEWYLLNKRDLPWRHEKDPYKIWLSEIILQQTQVVQGLGYYLKFTKKYPTVKLLAKAPEDEVLRLWQGLGYYSRARNLQASAKQVVGQFKGVFPTEHSDIKSLKGVGDYTAAAIASFAYDQPYAVVDGNVYRVLSRIFGIKTPIDTPAAKKQFQELANQLLDKKKPGIYNQAIMEFGSQYCRPVNPDCPNCIFNTKCYAFKTSEVAELPVKLKKTKIRNRYFNYIVLIDKNKNVLIRKRQEKDIWQGLYEFKLIETEKEIKQEDLFSLKEFKEISKQKSGLKYVSGLYKHILSHQHLYARFFVFVLSGKADAVLSGEEKKTMINAPVRSLNKYGFPRLIGKFMDDCDLKEML